MSAPRIDVQSRMATKLEDAGFQTNFSPIYWTYATGFPKATNVGRAVDKKLKVKAKSLGKVKGMGKQNSEWNGKLAGRKEDSFKSEYEKFEATSDEAKALDGSYVGFQPKPAVEVILVCMKPIEEKSYIDQAMKNGKGVTWLDDCRIPYKNEDDSSATLRANTKGSGRYKDTNRAVYGNYDIQNEEYDPTNGRFAANLIVQDDVLNDGKNRKGGTSNGDAKVGTKTNNAVTPLNRGTLISRNDEGSFSRFYDLDAWWKSQIHKLPESVQKTFPFMVVAKASKSEKNEAINNNHPTVKPIELMSYLITLGSRDNDVVVDPFAGSGTTCIAAKLLNRQYIGIEKEKDYAIIAKARIKNVESKENNKASQFFEL